MTSPDNRNAPARWIDADAYLFDIDGTLLHATGRAHFDAFTSALRYGLDIDTTINGVVWAGNTDIGILRSVIEREGVPAERFEAALPAILEHLCLSVEANRSLVRAEVCPGIVNIIDALNARGRLLGVASGNLERIGWIKIEAAGLRQHFSFGAFSDRFERRADIVRHGIYLARERLGTRARVCVIGDTPADIAAARANRVSVIAVATGIYSLEELAKHAPDLALGCCDEALPLA